MNPTENFTPKGPEKSQEVKKQPQTQEEKNSTIEKKASKISKTEVGKKVGKAIEKQTGAEKAGDTLKGILDGKEGDKKEISNKLDGIKTIDGKEVTKEKLKTLETRELLKMEISDRLNLVTKGGKIDRGDLKEGKEIEFNFSVDGEKNKNLYLNTSAGQVLPVEIGMVNVGGVEYKRHGYEGEFFNEKGERLLIDDGTKITIGKPRTNEDLKGIVGKMREDGNKLIVDLNIDIKKPKEGDKEKLDIIRESLKKGLNPNEVKTILDGKYEDLNKITPENRKKEVFKILMDLKQYGVLDGDTSGEKIDKKQLETFAEKYGITAEAIGIGTGGYAEYTSQTPPNLNFPEGTPEQLKKTINIAIAQLGIHENSGKADKFFKETGFPNLKANSTPWCAAFINWSLKEGGLQGTGSNLAKSFINGAGKGHVGFNVGGQLLGGNQSNRVSLKPLNYGKVEGWVLPTKMNEVHREGPFNKDSIPEGAIVVFGRGKNTT